MQAAIDFVTKNPGATSRIVIVHLLEAELATFEVTIDEKRRSRLFKKSAGVVDRIIRDRHVRRDAALRLYPWDTKLRGFAEALERAAFAAPDDRSYRSILNLACNAWRVAGDANRAQVLEGLSTPPNRQKQDHKEAS